jgi:hypothetical protein
MNKQQIRRHAFRIIFGTAATVAMLACAWKVAAQFSPGFSSPEFQPRSRPEFQERPQLEPRSRPEFQPRLRQQIHQLQASAAGMGSSFTKEITPAAPPGLNVLFINYLPKGTKAISVWITEWAD